MAVPTGRSVVFVTGNANKLEEAGFLYSTLRYQLIYAELPKEVKNTISHRYQALAAMSGHFSSQDNGTPDSKKK